ncbi:MAG TPA: phosphoribosylformylglycinamidine synthase subunit PurL [Candidatus Binatia bacterium]|nr:phosphoribosylformylglycinamidine synthase subunit PurL [Candidatus Binatia bacterium]
MHRIEVRSIVPDARANVRKAHLAKVGFPNITSVEVVDVYTIDAQLKQSLAGIASMLANPITQHAMVDLPQDVGTFDWALEIGFLPGVTDNVAATAKEGIEDLLKSNLPGVYTSQITFLNGTLSRQDVERIASALANPVIQRIHIKKYDEFVRDRGMDAIVPRVNLKADARAELVDVLTADDAELAVIGKQGIGNADGTRRGPLALDLTYMKTIQSYFRAKGRNPTDVELESIAQTWSEHCKHTIFADPLDDITDGLYHAYIKRATYEIRESRKRKGKDVCVSVFKDNSGAIAFDENWLITDKAETHNSPSALDPFGGSITGIVGVNRDAIGFGLGAKPILNRYGFCFADPTDAKPLYKGKTQKMLPPQMILEGVVQGVNAGGNCSGIPTPQGFLCFDERYKGKPLVFVGTVGLIPRTSAGRPSDYKSAKPGDYVVMVGGRVGKDGIHGATFSSEALDTGSPATAVQIGDPITQKKLSDAIVKEARDLGIYNSITDNGAGGLSCSVAEMARESGGCNVYLDKVPLKYPGLQPWEIWISESQERMTLAVAPYDWPHFEDLMKRRGVEATIIGEFTKSGKCVVAYNGKNVMDVDLEFLHDGLPPRPMQTKPVRQTHPEPVIPEQDLTQTLHRMLSRQNIASFEFISQQYDHEVQGTSVIKPLQGRGRVNGDASVIKPVFDSPKGVVVSQGINPSYSDIDTYHMAACAIDTSIRNAVAAGASLDHLALMDNFCWCSSTEPERLYQLKEAVRACYDVAVGFGTPFISGKDSMFNDFKGFDSEGKPVKISIPPTLLASSIGVIDDVTNAVSLDAKCAGDLVYILGVTHDELGASEYFAMHGAIGKNVPKVNILRNKKVYEALAGAVREGLIASAQGVGRGGLAVALAKTAMGGMLGMQVALDQVPGDALREDYALYSESQGRIMVTVNPKNAWVFEHRMNGIDYAPIGKVRDDKKFIIEGKTSSIATTVDALLSSYKSTFKEF